MKIITGAKLKVGDIIKVCWQPGKDMIISFRPYTGAYQNDPAWRGCRIAEFAINNVGMIIFNKQKFEVINE